MRSLVFHVYLHAIRAFRAVFVCASPPVHTYAGNTPSTNEKAEEHAKNWSCTKCYQSKSSANTSISNCFAPFRRAVPSSQMSGSTWDGGGEALGQCSSSSFSCKTEPDRVSFLSRAGPLSPLRWSQAALPGTKQILPFNHGAKFKSESTAISRQDRVVIKVCISFWKSYLCHHRRNPYPHSSFRITFQLKHSMFLHWQRE